VLDACSCQADTQSDYLEFSNFNVKLIDRKMSRLCGSKDKLRQKEVASDGRFFRATFHSNEVYDASGFEAVYQFRKVEGKISSVRVGFLILFLVITSQIN